MHGSVSTAGYLAGELIGFTAGLQIAVLLLILTLRAAKLPGTPRANVFFAVCALFWNAGGLAWVAFLAAGLPRNSRFVLVAQAFHFSGAGAWPIPVLAIWSRYALQPWQKTSSRLLQICACLSAITIAMLLWVAPLETVEPFIFYNVALLLALGCAVSLRPGSTPRAVYLPSLVMVVAACGASVGIASDGAGKHLALLVILCTFLLFARFRFADLFIRYGVRIVLAAASAAILVHIVQMPFLSRLAGRALAPQAVHAFGITLLATAFLLLFAFADEPASRLVSRWLFHAPDYRAAIRRLGETLGRLQLESEVAAAVEEAARSTLELDGARLIPLGDLPWPAAVLEGEIVELDFADSLLALLPLPKVEWLVPAATAGRITHLLLVAPGPDRLGLVTNDLNYLRSIATQFGNRLDALRLEREAIERLSRETLLLQQVTEAELRALRAQVNPHFLFNSLNTIADLIVRDPGRAEAMTLRLASVFRHVLAQSSRPLTSIREEIEFVRTYLYIEEARFGERLRIEIDVAPEVASQSIPSLILQPLVENALKHGLGPKPGPGHLWISAQAQGDQVRLRVEDDGMGPNGRSPGLGLANVAERLRTLYHDRAGVRLEPREAGGSRVTVLIPLGEAAPAV